MRKSFLFIIAGTGLLLAGCNATNHRYQMIPVDGSPAGEVDPGDIPVAPPVKNFSANQTQFIPEPITTPAPTPTANNYSGKYQPMSGVKSTGGVDSTEGSKGGATTVNGVKYHVIQRGEYPGLIANKYKIRLAALMKANNLNEKSAKALKVGQKLIIPTGADAAVTGGQRRSAGSSAATLVNGKHKVQRGETLDVIARRYKVKLSDLMSANNMTEASARRMQIGQLLTIPGKTSSAATANTGSSTSSTANSNNSKKQNTVVDPLMMELDMIILDADTSAADIAAKYGIPLSVFQEINGGLTDTRLFRGMAVLVPKK
ncbi:MAG: LysM peptidoglycan-binding domain-containing protein [Lentisphaerae bacterium]|nr:LysM peptidoglycan-binding domain-containing protein [Lentisphaerota bacterium]